jgi:hypothetical protein
MIIVLFIAIVCCKKKENPPPTTSTHPDYAKLLCRSWNVESYSGKENGNTHSAIIFFPNGTGIWGYKTEWKFTDASQEIVRLKIFFPDSTRENDSKTLLLNDSIYDFEMDGTSYHCKAN